MRTLIVILIALLLAGQVAGAEKGLLRTSDEYALSPQQAMWAKISAVKFEGTTLRECFDWLGEVLGTNLFVDWGALKEAGVEPDQPINLKLRWVRVPRLLQLIFQETGHGEALAHHISGNILVITSRAKADAEIFTRVYPVQDLVLQPSKVDRVDREVLDPTGGSNSTASDNRGGVGQSNNRNNNRNSNGNGDVAEDDSDADRGQGLIEAIKKMTPSDLWEENGGKSKAAYFRGNLILTAPRSVHALIGGPVRE